MLDRSPPGGGPGTEPHDGRRRAPGRIESLLDVSRVLLPFDTAEPSVKGLPPRPLQPLWSPRTLSWLADTAAFLGLTAALFYITRHAAHPLSLPDSRLLWLWIPLAFGAQSALVAVLGWITDPPWRWRAYAIDLLAWAPPLLIAFGLRLHEVSDATPWLAIALFCKAGALLFAVSSAIRRGLSDRWAAIALVVAAFVFYVLAIPFTRLDVLDGHSAGLAGDEPTYMITTVSLLRDHDLFVDDEYARQVYWSFYPASLGVGHSVQARDGHIASFHDAGLSILATVPYALGGWKMVLVAIALATAALLGQVYRTVRSVGVAAQPALAAVALSGFTLPLAAYSTQVYPEVLVGLAAVVAVRQLWAAQVGSRASPALVGLALAAMPWLHVRAWPLVAVLTIAALMVWRQWVARGTVLLLMLTGAVGYVLLNLYVYGHLQLSPAVGGSLLQELRSLQRSVIAIGEARPWLDGYDGLLLLAPFFVLALAGVPLLARMGWAGRGTVAAIVLYGALIGIWDLVSNGGWAPPGRFMVPAVPLLTIGLAVAFEAFWRRPVGVLVIGPLAAWAFACSFYTFADRIGVYTVDRTAGAVGAVSRLSGIPLPTAAPAFDQPDFRSFAEVAAAVAVVTGLYLWISRDRARWRTGSGVHATAGVTPFESPNGQPASLEEAALSAERPGATTG